MSAPVNLPRYWTTHEIERLRYLRSELGLAPRAIAPMLDRTPYSIKAKVEALGLDLPANLKRGTGSTIPLDMQAKVRRYWMRGETIETCANALGLFEPRVARAYRQFSEDERDRPAVPPQIGSYIGAREMMAIVAPICGVAAKGIPGPLRLKSYVCARIAIAQALKDRGLAAGVIAHALGRSDHTTALHWFKKFKPYCTIYPETLRAYEAIKSAEAIIANRRAAA